MSFQEMNPEAFLQLLNVIRAQFPNDPEMHTVVYLEHFLAGLQRRLREDMGVFGRPHVDAEDMGIGLVTLDLS